jgi:anaerobic selenocysteine-containing dehydrogenase
MQRIGTLVYLSTTFNTGHVRARGRETIILPVLARDEEPQSSTQESMFNYVRVSDGGKPRHDGPRAETEVIADLAAGGFESPPPIDLEAMRTHVGIRDAIADVVPGYGQITAGQEFHIPDRTFHTPEFATKSGRAQIQNVEIPEPAPLEDRQVRVVTVRSEGQFNTVVYEDEDVYRGIPRRDAILLNASDMKRWGISTGDRVDVQTEAGSMNVVAFDFDITSGAAAMYFPECNVLVPRRLDPSSRTPGFKGFVATLSDVDLRVS